VTLQEVEAIATTENLNIIFIDNRQAVANNRKRFIG